MRHSAKITAIFISLLSLTLLIAAGSDKQGKAKKTNKIPPGVEELAIGAKAPDFNLLGTDQKKHALKDMAGEKGTLVIFTCNHCPYAKAYQDRIIDLAWEYQPRGIGVVAISSNDADAYADDSFPKMQERATEKGFNFPYLYDQSQAVALQYGPMVTPHTFLFDSSMTLVYRGRIDNSAKLHEVKDRDLNDALLALTAGKTIKVQETKAFGCSIKWKPEVLKSGKAAKTDGDC
jgi:peroxiredoxin